MKSYTKREIAHLLGVSPRTITEDIKQLNLVAEQGDRGLNLYNQSQFDLISQLREHCADKSNSRESFVPSSQVEIVKSNQQVAKTKPVHKREDETTPSHGVARYVRLDIYKESLLYGLAQDPLFDLELLQRICQGAYLLPTSRLAPILGLSPISLSKRTEYSYCGFMCSKEYYESGRAMWRVEKI